ncbi:hypothetical protein HYH03_007958 [Edaphochlamys debaryana]|uniref:Uncharacterized protein n=1 Tax=Edaphochlamys debaryana TaxID=47281 RepID=A0A836BYN0_9CHLO|nr:hypothetical protein HYH03_007958 [Edaphochlamys debaryana]|eukprot:KAG2493735.1 hypothetical protein HYH03_007958 [Edaphochlamys debaryana]
MTFQNYSLRAVLLCVVLTCLQAVQAGRISCSAQFFGHANYEEEIAHVALKPASQSAASTIIPDLDALIRANDRAVPMGFRSTSIGSLHMLCICLTKMGTCDDDFSQVTLRLYTDPFHKGTRGGATRDLRCTQLADSTYCSAGLRMRNEWADDISAIAFLYGQNSYEPPDGLAGPDPLTIGMATD